MVISRALVLLWVCTGDIAAFGSDLGVRQSVSLATRLDWCLSDAQEWVDQINDDDRALGSKPDAGVETDDSEMTPDSTEKEDDLNLRITADRKESVSATAARRMREGSAGRRRRWILKPSTLNKGAGLAFGEGFEPLRKAIHESPDIREWVLQEYVDRPLLVQGRKFHLRAYVLAGLHGFRYSVFGENPSPRKGSSSKKGGFFCRGGIFVVPSGVIHSLALGFRHPMLGWSFNPLSPFLR